MVGFTHQNDAKSCNENGSGEASFLSYNSLLLSEISTAVHSSVVSIRPSE